MSISRDVRTRGVHWLWHWPWLLTFLPKQSRRQPPLSHLLLFSYSVRESDFHKMRMRGRSEQSVRQTVVKSSISWVPITENIGISQSGKSSLLTRIFFCKQWIRSWSLFLDHQSDGQFLRLGHPGMIIFPFSLSGVTSALPHIWSLWSRFTQPLAQFRLSPRERKSPNLPSTASVG